MCFPKKLWNIFGTKFGSWSSQKVQNFKIWEFLQWETTVYFWTFFGRLKTLLDTLTYSALLSSLQRLCTGNPNHVFSGTVIPFQTWKWAEISLVQKQCVWDWLWIPLYFRDSDHDFWTVAVVIWVKGLELAQLIWHYLSNCWLGLAQIIWHYRAPRNRTTWIQQSLIIMSWWRKERRNSCVFGVLGYLSLWMGNIKVARWNGFEILIPKNMWKSKIGLLEQIWGQNPYDTFFLGHPVFLGNKENVKK